MKLLGGSYTYQSLKTAKDEIRLIRLASSTSRKVCLRVEHFKLQSTPFYLALSYAWGPADHQKFVKVDDRRLKIRQNLYYFLREFQRRVRIGQQELCWLWIDAICIDQDSVDEKAKQIPIMKSIYEKAQYVVIWLGPVEHDSPRAMSLIERLYTLDFQNHALFNFTDQSAKAFVEACSQAITDKELIAYGSLVQRSWWRRAWVLVEASTPSLYDHDVWCGRHRSTMKVFFAVSAILNEYATWAPDLQVIENRQLTNTDIFVMSYLWSKRMNYDKGAPLNYIEMLNLAHSFETTDARDKIYAVLPIFSENVNVTPNYSLSTRDVYVDFARSLLLDCQNKDVLGVYPSELDTDLPSWVPDWAGSAHVFRKYRWNSDGRCACDLYDACKGLESQRFRIEDNDTLLVYGIDVDRVLAVSSVHDSSAAGGHDDVAISWSSFVREHSADSCSLIFEALLHTLCADLQYENQDAMKPKRGAQVTLDGESKMRRELTREAFIHPLAERATWGRRLIVTKEGRVGLGSKHAQPGDWVCIFCDFQMPFLLRRVDDHHFILIGESYVHGIMDGEAVVENPEREITCFNIR